MPGFPDADDYDSWVRLLADPLRARRAHWHLVLSGRDSLNSVRRGLASPNDDVRRWSAKVMDHLVDESSVDTLLDMLRDSNPQVRIEACHALACDRCKANGCRPCADTVLATAIDVLLHDPDRHVRAYAVELVGRSVHTHLDAEVALIHSRDNDLAPAVRKKAGWFAPGGTIHRKTAPRLHR